jgi:hypothetical protein
MLTESAIHLVRGQGWEVKDRPPMAPGDGAEDGKQAQRKQQLVNQRRPGDVEPGRIMPHGGKRRSTMDGSTTNRPIAKIDQMPNIARISGA